MADQKINIAIGSTYSGNGMNQALSGVDKLSKNAGKAAGAVGSLGNALGGMGGKAGQAIGAVTKLTSALAMGGPIGLAIAGVTALIGAFNDYTEKQEAAKKAADEHAKMLKALQDEAEKKAYKAFVDDLAKGRVEADKMATALQKVISLESALASAKQNNVTAAQSLEQAELAASTAAKVRAESTPEGKALAQAKGGVAMAQMRGDANIANAQTKAQAIGSNINALEQTYDAMVGMHDALERKIQELEEAWVNSNQDDIETAILDARGDGKYDGLNASQQAEMDAKIKNQLMAKDVELQKKIAAIYEEEAKIQERIRDEGLKIAALREQQEAADKAILQAKVEAAANLAAAKDAEKKAEDAKLAAEDEAAGKRLEEEEKIAEDKRKEEIAESERLGKIEWQRRKEIEKAEKAEAIQKIDDEIKVAKENLKAAIQRAEQAFANAHTDLNLVYNGAISGTPAGGGTGNAEKDNQTAERQAKGMSKSVNWGTGRAFDADKAARYKKFHGNEFGGFSQKEQRDYDDLKAKEARGRIGDKDRERLKKYRERDPELKAQEEAKKAAEAAKKLKELEEAKKQLQEDAYHSMINVFDYVVDIYDYVSPGPQ